jgi:hypothetical protein
MVMWEYAQIRAATGVIWWTAGSDDRQLDGSNVFDHLNAAGRDGWELVGMTEAPDTQMVAPRFITKYVLKRKIDADR